MRDTRLWEKEEELRLFVLSGARTDRIAALGDCVVPVEDVLGL